MNGRIIPALMIVMCLLCMNAYAITAIIGEEVYISGSKPPRADIYLVVTGPNLPSCGAQMDNINAAVQNGVSGSFTIALESSDTGWFYRWDTSRLAGISPGTYLVYAVTLPADACHLAGQEYSTVAVTLRTPSLYVETPAGTFIPATTQVPETETPTPAATETINPVSVPATESAPLNSAWLLPVLVGAFALASSVIGSNKKR